MHGLRSSLRRRVVREFRAAYLRIENSRLAPLLRVRFVQRIKARVAHTPAWRVLRLLDEVSASGVQAWVAGGWGIDALAGRQTRRHHDLDLVISDAPEEYQKVAEALTREGFRPDAPEFNAGLPMPWRCAWHHDEGHTVEILPVALRKPPFSAVPGNELACGDGTAFAHGTIGGRPVPCLSASLQLALHGGYPLRDIDEHDTDVLREYVNRQEGTAQM